MKNKLLTATLAGLFLYTASYSQATLYRVSDGNSIFTINNVSNTPVISQAYPVSGIASGQVLVGLDTWPGEDGIYALGYDATSLLAELYTISGSGTQYTANPVSGTLANLDLGSPYNVVVRFVSASDNELMITGSNGNSYVVNANTGVIVGTGGNGLNPAEGDLKTNAGVSAETATMVNEDLLVYPNPTAGITHVELDVVPVAPVNAYVIDMNGQIVRSYQYASGSYLLDIDMSELPTGLYSVRVWGNDIGYHNLKVVKN